MADARDRFRDILARRSRDELYRLAHVKRFVERYQADPAFRAKLNEPGCDLLGIAHAYGIDVDPAAILPLFSPAHAQYRRTDEEARWPLAKMWSDFERELLTLRDVLRERGDTAEANPAFHAWRQRQIARGLSELRGSGPCIPHVLAAYELSDGCSVGCWFCAVSAERFRGHLPYTPASAALWRGVLAALVALFGEAAGTGFCYWATDPADNPDYDRYIEDHHAVTGMLPQTTTAMPFKDEALIRRVMALSERCGSFPNRFSVLTLKALDRIHAAFTPEELLRIELVPQNRGALLGKANAGRARARRESLLAAGREDDLALNDDHTTIACVSGFVVNLPQRTVRMVSPTRAGERWPLGYRVYEEARFEDAESFRAAVEAMVSRHCVTGLQPHDRLAFRPDLHHLPLDDGFEVRSETQRHLLQGLPFARHLGELIARGTLTAGEIQSMLAGNVAELFLVMNALQDLFDRGLLDDDPKYGGIGAVASPEPAALAG